MRLAIPAGARAIYHYGGWTLYELPPKPGDSILWRSFRLMVPPETPARWRQVRAFTLTWNPLELRLRKDAARVVLELGHPDLYHRVVLTLTLSYGPEWLRDTMRVSDTEIAAERERLKAAARTRRAAKRRSTTVRPPPNTP